MPEPKAQPSPPSVNLREHWSGIYAVKRPDQVTWYQPLPERSLDLIRRLAPDRAAPIIDVGGGASTLVDHLLELGYHDLTVLDLAGPALQHAQRRLGPRADRVRWVEADILTTSLPPAGFQLWHDRAVFHFLTDPGERRRYVSQLSAALRPGGFVVLGTFALDGPERCSGLPVERHSADSLAAALGAGFGLVEQAREIHHTPSGTDQAYQYAAFHREAA